MSEEQVRALIARLRVKAIQSREEGQRIRLTVHVATDAESNCHVRAEVWDDVANELEALLAQAQPSPQMTAMQMLQKCLAVVVGYEHTLSWPNHPNNEDMQAAAMDTTIAIEDAMLKLREEIGEAQPVADAPNDQLIFNGVVYVRAGAQPPAEGLREPTCVTFEDSVTQRDGTLTLQDRVFSMLPTNRFQRGDKVRVTVENLTTARAPVAHRETHEWTPGIEYTHCCECGWDCSRNPPINALKPHTLVECERQWKAHIASLDAPKRRDA